MLSATLQGFLPDELEPLGFSSPGQLRVASQLNSLNQIKKKISITFWLLVDL